MKKSKLHIPLENCCATRSFITLRLLSIVFILIAGSITPLLSSCAESLMRNSVFAWACSYDFSYHQNWGIGETLNWSADEYNQNGIVEYGDVSYSYVKEHCWVKCWIRVKVYPHSHYVGIEDSILSGNAMQLTNVRIQNSTAVGIYPLSNLYYSATDVELEEKGVFSDASTWILEAIVQVNNRSLEDLCDRIKNAQIFFDYFEQYNGTEIEGIRIDTCNIVRQVYDPSLKIDFSIDGICRDSITFSTAVANHLIDMRMIPQEKKEIILSNIENYALYELYVSCTNGSEWPVYGIQACLSEKVENLYLVMQYMNNDAYGGNNIWIADTQPVKGVFIICDRGVTTEEIINTMNDNNISFLVSTEAVGKAEFSSGYESIIYLGKRFKCYLKDKAL